MTPPQTASVEIKKTMAAEVRDDPDVGGEVVPIATLIRQLSRILYQPENAIKDATESQRLQFIQLARAAAVGLETEYDTMQRLVFSPLELIITRIAQDRGILTLVSDAKQPVQFDAIQEASNLDTNLLNDILAYMCGSSMVQETGKGLYSGTVLTTRLATSRLQDAVIHYHDNILPGLASLKTVLDRRPNETLNAFKLGHHTNDGFYEWVSARPELRDAFHRFMTAQFSSLPSWVDAVDFEKEFGQGLAANETAFVDVGGSNGHQCAALKAKLPQLPGRIILQDKPEVLAGAMAVPGMETQAYDYLTPQPILGARVYYFRQIMHNNDDDTCIRILQAHIAAMSAASVIIIDDKALPDSTLNAEMSSVQYTASLSLLMTTVFNAQERRESSWHKLITRAGLKIREIRKFSIFHDALIIVELP